MDSVVFGAIFFAGLLVGGYLAPERKGELPCSCQCHCAAPSIIPESAPIIPTEFLWLVSVLLSIITVTFAVGHLDLWPRGDTSPAKGKGKKGVFGSNIPLQIRDGSTFPR